VNREPSIPIEIIPGPSAVTMALAAGGIAGPHLFYGFLPHKSAQRRKALTQLAPLPYTLVFFESPYRLVKSLRDMHELLGNRHAVVARELTKKFEEIIRGDLATILKKLENRSIKGEITLVVEGHKE
jgi:16S rRNA (cytidine1402-2'-O)-methyltransferase